MMDEFDTQQLQEMNIPWLIQNGWTVPGNLAYKRILKESAFTGVLQLERIEEMLISDQVDSTQIVKIQTELKELIALKREFFK